MTITHVATGELASGIGTTCTITSPAGSIGDLVLFFMIHDDYSQGAWAPSTPPITLTSVHDGSPQIGDDTRFAIFWGTETQEAGRTFDFTFAVLDGYTGVCIRYSGHDTTTPIQVTSRETGPWIVGTDADYYGDMFISFVGGDSNVSTFTTPTGWTHRVTSSFSTAYFCIHDKSATTYPFPMVLDDYGLQRTHTTDGDFQTLTFVIADALSSSATITGTTKDKDGDVLGSCEVHCFKRVSSSDIQWVGSTTSNAETGAYTFTFYNDTDAKFFVVAFEASGTHRMDATDYVLQPS